MGANTETEATDIHSIDIKGYSQEAYICKTSCLSYQVANYDCERGRKTAVPAYNESLTYSLRLVPATSSSHPINDANRLLTTIPHTVSAVVRSSADELQVEQVVTNICPWYMLHLARERDFLRLFALHDHLSIPYGWRAAMGWPRKAGRVTR